MVSWLRDVRHAGCRGLKGECLGRFDSGPANDAPQSGAWKQRAKEQAR
nr:MAG TPA: hypothetical protein [Caudoviricetes sp.]